MFYIWRMVMEALAEYRSRVCKESSNVLCLFSAGWVKHSGARSSQDFGKWKRKMRPIESQFYLENWESMVKEPFQFNSEWCSTAACFQDQLLSSPIPSIFLATLASSWTFSSGQKPELQHHRGLSQGCFPKVSGLSICSDYAQEGSSQERSQEGPLLHLKFAAFLSVLKSTTRWHVKLQVTNAPCFHRRLWRGDFPLSLISCLLSPEPPPSSVLLLDVCFGMWCLVSLNILFGQRGVRRTKQPCPWDMVSWSLRARPKHKMFWGESKELLVNEVVWDHSTFWLFCGGCFWAG